MERRVELGGKTRSLRYTVNAMCAVEDRAGMTLDELLKTQFLAARLLVWGGMLEGCPELTVEEAGRIIDGELARGKSLDDVIGMCALSMRDAGFFGRKADCE